MIKYRLNIIHDLFEHKVDLEQALTTKLCVVCRLRKVTLLEHLSDGLYIPVFFAS